VRFAILGTRGIPARYGGFETFAEELSTRLAARGHRIAKKPTALGGYQAIWREEDPRRYFGGSDPRKDGEAIGY